MVLHSQIEGLGNPTKIIIIHGFLGMSDNWKSIATKLALEQFEIHSVDVRNHGRSFHSEEFTYEIMAEDIKTYCDTNNITNTSILGHSMGGKIAMLFSTKYPNYLNKLIVADIGPKSYPPHHQNILEGINAIDFNRITSRNEVDAILSQHISEVGTRQFLMKNLFRETSDTFNFRFNRKILTEKIDEIGKALPDNNLFFGETLFLRGALSTYILDEDIDSITRHFPKATLKTIENAGHWLHAENPTAFYEALINFIK
ncbi:MAG: alpha/beta fold hydrolase [Flavobacteriales bacterium]|nr:alpha/beta fold hydrolase [Flavobacteriales bacterium]